MKFLHSHVRTLDSHSIPGRPFWFKLDGMTGLEIEEIVDHWKEAYLDPCFYPQEYYRVQASDKQMYILKYSTLFRSWWGKRCGESQ